MDEDLASELKRLEDEFNEKLNDPKIQQEPVIRDAYESMLDAVRAAEEQLKGASKLGRYACQKIFDECMKQLYG